MGHGMVAASCVILIDLVIQIVSSFPRPVPVPGLVGVSTSAQRLTNGEFRLLWANAVRPLQAHASTKAADHEIPSVEVAQDPTVGAFQESIGNAGRGSVTSASSLSKSKLLPETPGRTAVKKPAPCLCSRIHGRLAAVSIASGGERQT